MREGSKTPRADWKLMTRYTVLVPPPSLLGTLEENRPDMTGQIRDLCFQNRNRKAARDLLLPCLMSVEITV